MKKVYIAIAVLAAAALTSCNQEKSFDDSTPIGENGIAFKISGVTSTRSGEGTLKSEKGATFEIVSKESGEAFSLEETITELNPMPATKGVPAYEPYLGELYPNMGVYASGKFGDASFEVMDEFENPNGGDGWRYHHNYNGSPWPDEETVVDFYLRMPATATGVPSFSHANNKVKFTLTSPEIGTAQQDLLLAHTAISKKQHNDYLPNGAPVMMYHALSGVKFRTGNNNENETKTIITRVELLNLYDKATCTYDPSAEQMFTWDGYKMEHGSFSQDFQSYTYDKDSDNTVDYIKGQGDVEFGDAWYKSGNNAKQPFNKNNLNDEDGSMTFWFIPQTLTKDVVLNVYFKVLTPDTKIVQEIKHTIKIGEQLEGVEWKAGQLRTYSLEPKDVDVEIFDTMSGYSKTGLHVTNTGNVDEYIRMLVIGNWYGWTEQEEYEAYLAGDLTHAPKILVGYTTDGTDGKNEMASPWFRGDSKWGSYFDDTFKQGNPTNEKWVKGTGAYYYLDVIGPGDKMTAQEAGTKPLFQSYNLPQNEVPTIYVPVTTSNVRKPAIGVHLVMEIVVQAIASVKDDGTPYKDCWEAWSAATNSTIAPSTSSSSSDDTTEEGN